MTTTEQEKTPAPSPPRARPGRNRSKDKKARKERKVVESLSQVFSDKVIARGVAPRNHLAGQVFRFGVYGCAAGTLLAGSLVPAATGAIVATNIVHDAWMAGPDSIPAPVLPGRTALRAADGSKVVEVFTINRLAVPEDKQNLLVRNAVVAVEDSRFYTHNGVDPVGMLRAFKSSAGGAAVQGGSTITQQYAKNLRLMQVLVESGGTLDQAALNSITERSWQRKVAEAKVALMIEQETTKADILTGYLNVSYFGAGAYGIEAAARRYFSVPAAKLTLPQAALLAGIVQSPNELDPRRNPKGALNRRDQVLSAMAEHGYATPAEAAAAKAAPLVLKTSLPAQGCTSAAIAWGMVCDAAMRELRDADWLGPQGQSLLSVGGLSVQLTVDPKTQQAARNAAASAVPPTHRVANAITMVEPGTGEIKAMASNRKFGDGEGASEIPLATAQAFAPASTFKLFTLIAALEDGIPLSTVLPGGTSYRSDKFDNPPGGYHNAEGLSMSNVTVSKATEMSINTAYVQLEERVGISAVADAAKRLGISSIGAPGTSSYPGKQEGSFALGARDVSVTDMAGAYAAIAAAGKWCPPTLIASVTLPDGTVIKNPSRDSCRQAVDPAVADTAASVLEGVLSRGTAKKVSIGRPAAGKTGTGEDASSAWFAGFTPQIAAAVWTGDPKSPNNTLHNVLGLRIVYGSTLPGQVWAESMGAYLKGKPELDLPSPDPDYLLALGAPPIGKVIVADLRGQTSADAAAALAAAGLRAKIVNVPVSEEPWVRAGTVVGQNKQAGTGVDPGTEVRIRVASNEGEQSPP